MRTNSIAPLTALAFASSAQARLFTVENNCPSQSGLLLGPDFPAGWEQAAVAIVSFGVPNNWKPGCIWARKDYNFSINPGPMSCLTGGCNGRQTYGDWLSPSVVG